MLPISATCCLFTPIPFPPQVSCSASGVAAGIHDVVLAMQPVGAAAGDFTYEVVLAITSVDPSEGEGRGPLKCFNIN